MSTPNNKPIQCDAWRRVGGAFTFGPTKWVQCPNDAVVLLTIEQDGEITEDSPACNACWQEGIKAKIKQIAAKPLPTKP